MTRKSKLDGGCRESCSWQKKTACEKDLWWEKRLVLSKKNEGERGTELVLGSGRVLWARMRVCDLF